MSTIAKAVKHFLLSSLFITTILWTSTASASDLASDVEANVKHGLELRRGGDDQAALPFFEKAYALGHSPRAAAQLGLCEMALGRWPRAETHVTEALHSGVDPWVVRNRSVLEDSLRTIKGHIARLEIVGSPPGAKISVNGESVGVLPLSEPVRIATGTVEIEARAPGYRKDTKTITMTGPQFQRVTIELEKDADVASAAVPTATREAESAPQDSAVVARAPSAGSSTTSHPFYKKTWFWVTVGVVVAAGVAGAVLVAGGGTSYPSPQQQRTVQ